MAAPVTALQPLRLPSGPSPLTSEQRYWRSFRSQQLIPSLQNTSITHISAPITPPQSQVVSPEVFAVTSGGRVQIYSSRTGKVVKNISRFGYDDVARSGEIRPDGRVVAAGGDSGGIQVFDVNSRAILKTWKQHKQPVWSIRWSPNDLTLLMSTCDDRTVRLWDLSSQESTVTFTGHQDYVRCGAFMPGQNTNLLVSGSYDQTLRVWDKRTPDNAVMTFKYGAPLESVLPMPTGTTVLSTADNIISVVDLVAAKLLHQIRSHQKTVTSICLASNNTRLVSGGLDGHLKVHEISGWSVVAASKYPSPIISLAVIGGGIQREDKHLAVGMQSGLLSIRTRLAGQQKAQERERAKEMQALMQGTIDDYDKKTSKKQNKQGLAKRYRGVDYDGHGADIIVEGTERRKRKKLPCWDRALRNIQYGKALDLALNVEPPSPITVLTVLTALRDRSALKTALQDRDEVTLKPLLSWLAKHISDPRHVVMTTRVSMLVLELYADHLGQSAQIDGLVERLHDRVRLQVENSQTACSTQGMLEMLMVADL